MKISIIIPCYNEEKTIEKIIQKVTAEFYGVPDGMSIYIQEKCEQWTNHD